MVFKIISLAFLCLLGFYIERSSSINIPNKAILLEKFGVVIEPDSVIFHHDQVIYFSVGVRLSLMIDPLKSGSPRSGCNIAKPAKKELLEKVISEVEAYFRFLPKTFDLIHGHYCKGTEIDCMILENKWDPKNFLDDDIIEDQEFIYDLDNPTYNFSQPGTNPEHIRGKRQALLGTFVVGGLTAAAVSLYNYVSNKEVQGHLDAIDNYIKEDQYQLYSLEANQKQYIEKSNNLFIKMFQGFLNNEKHLLDLLCNASSAAEIETAGIVYSNMLDNYKHAVGEAMEGKVTDFLVTHNLLQDMLSKREDLKSTVYSIDPGLFYIASTSMLTKVDSAHNTAYFLITTPLLKQEDVSPLYRISNFGWITNGALVHFKLPEYIYYLTDVERDAKMIASPDLSKCQNKKGLYICNLKETSLTDGTNCLQHVLHANNTSGCKLTTATASRHCFFKILKSGVGIFGCDKIQKGNTVRGLSNWKTVDLNPDTFHFYPYSTFESLSVGSTTITSRKTYMRIFRKTKLDLPEVNIAPYTHLMIPGVEHEIAELEEFKKNKSSGFLGHISYAAEEHHSWVLWIAISISLISVFIGICWAVRGCRRCCRATNSYDEEPRFYLRDGRGISLS